MKGKRRLFFVYTRREAKEEKEKEERSSIARSFAHSWGSSS
jgi:hypothetical protein